jgi:magnesium-transporting ATPase (P-type)
MSSSTQPTCLSSWSLARATSERGAPSVRSVTHAEATGAPPATDRGLTEAEAQRRRAERPPAARSGASRSYGSIVRANVLTLFNLILAAFGTVTLLYGDWRDALFLGILVANTSIGIVQEVRAKRALDRLSALVAPTATHGRCTWTRWCPATSSVSLQATKWLPTAACRRQRGWRSTRRS